MNDTRGRVQVFAPCLSPVGNIDMEMLLANFRYEFHPRSLDGTFTPQQCVADLEDGIRLGRETAPTTEDLMDYWAFVSFKVHIYDMYVNIYMCIHTYIDR